MIKIFLILIIIQTMLLIFCLAEIVEQKQENAGTTTEPEYRNVTDAIEKAMVTIENAASVAEKFSRDGVVPSEETDQIYNKIMETVAELNEIVKTPENAYKFLKAKGINRVIIPNMDVKHSRMRGLVLIMLKNLFHIVPTTTDAVIHVTAIDKLLDIFENDDNLAMKAHALDIMYVWLPNNPQAQVRVMKLKGLEPFYNQIEHLDTSVISTLLDLFNTILKEHLKVRNDKTLRNKMESKKLILYQRIGLIERMSTPQVCNGLLNIFESTWSYSNEYNDVIGPVFELIKNMKPYCVQVLRGKNKAVEIFQALLKYVGDDTKKEYFENLDVNVTDTKLILEEFMSELKQPPVKDEF